MSGQFIKGFVLGISGILVQASVPVSVPALGAQEPLVDVGSDVGTEAGAEAEAGEEEAEDEPPALTGRVTRDDVERAVPEWVQAEIEAEVETADALRLAHVDPGAEVTVFLGTWCSDSKRELTHLWRAFDEAGGLVSFEIDYIGVDRDKEQPEELIEGSGLAYVPTFIVRRDGEEVGRIVEEAPDGIVHDLAALLTGEASGVVSARDDLEPVSPNPEP